MIVTLLLCAVVGTADKIEETAETGSAAASSRDVQPRVLPQRVAFQPL